MLISFGWNNIYTISWVYCGSIYQKNLTTPLFWSNTPLLYLHRLSGRIDFLPEVHNRMDGTASLLWHLSYAKLTYIFNRCFQQARSRQICNPPKATWKYTATVLNAKIWHGEWQTPDSMLIRPPGGSGFSSPPGSISELTSPTAVTPYPSSRYFHTTPSLASFYQMDDVSRNNQSIDTFSQLVR